MKEIMEKLLEEVDIDIKEAMMKKDQEGVEHWGYLNSPALTVIEWQRMRNDRMR